MRYFLSFFLFIQVALADIDTLYKNLSHFLTQTVNKLDQILSDSNASATPKVSLTTSIDTIIEKNMRYSFHISTHITLPRTQKKLRLFLEDFKKDSSVNEESQESLNNSLSNTPVLLGLGYLSSGLLRYRAGVKFHGISPDPFVGAGIEYTRYFSKGWLYMGEYATYYIDAKFDNHLFADYQLPLNKRALFSLENRGRYTQDDRRYQYSHTLKLYYSFSKNEILTPLFSIYCTQNAKEGYKLDYYFLALDYQNTIFRRWLFYNLQPGYIWRREKNFNGDFRFLFRIGIRFAEN